MVLKYYHFDGGHFLYRSTVFSNHDFDTVIITVAITMSNKALVLLWVGLFKRHGKLRDIFLLTNWGTKVKKLYFKTKNVMKIIQSLP